MEAKAIFIKYWPASDEQFDCLDNADCLILSGPHEGHVCRLFIQKSKCGDFWVEAQCECGSRKIDATGGCELHSPVQNGDKDLPSYATPVEDLWWGDNPTREIAVVLAAFERGKVGVSIVKRLAHGAKGFLRQRRARWTEGRS